MFDLDEIDKIFEQLRMDNDIPPVEKKDIPRFYQEVNRSEYDRKVFSYSPISQEILYEDLDFEYETPEVLLYKSENVLYIKEEFQDNFFMALYKATRERVPLEHKIMFNNKKPCFSDNNIKNAVNRLNEDIILSEILHQGYDIKYHGQRDYLPDFSEIVLYEYSPEHLQALRNDKGFREIEDIDAYREKRKNREFFEEFTTLCYDNNTKALEKFIREHKLSNFCFSEGLGILVVNGYLDALKVVLKSEQGVKSLYRGFWLYVEFAIEADHENIVLELLKYKDISWYHNFSQEDTPLILSIKNRQPAITKLLLDDGRINPAYDNNKALILASDYGYTEIVKAILQDHRVDSIIDKNFALTLAKDYGYQEIIDLLTKDITYKE